MTFCRIILLIYFQFILAQDNNYAREGPTQSNLTVQYENDRVQVLKNAGYVPSSPEESPCVTEDEIDELPHVTVRNKRFIKRQSSREAQGIIL